MSLIFAKSSEKNKKAYAELLRKEFPDLTIRTDIEPGDPEWYVLHRAGLGGTDVAAILNLNRYKSALEVYADKKGLSPKVEVNEAMEWGSRHEATIRTKFAEEHPNWDISPGFFYKATDGGVVLGDVDGLIWEDKKPKYVLEIKAPGARAGREWGAKGSDYMPKMYHIQGDWYLGGLGLDGVYTAALIGGNDYREYFTSRDEQLIAEIANQTGAWWRQHITADEPPPPDASDSATNILKLLYPRDERKDYTPTARDVTHMKLYRETLIAANQLYSQAKGIENQLRSAIKEHGRMVVDGVGYITYRNNKDSIKTNYKGAFEILAAEHINDHGGDAAIHEHVKEIIAKHTKTIPGARVWRKKFDETGRSDG